MIERLRQFHRRFVNSAVAMRVARGAGWQLAGAFGSRVVAMIGFIAVARMLGKEGFGAFGMIVSTTTMWQTFAGFGMGITSTKHVAEFRQQDPARAGRLIALANVVSLAAGLAIFAAVFAFAEELAAHVLNAPHLGGLLKRASPALLFVTLANVQMGSLVGFEAFPVIARINIAVGLVNPILCVAGVLWRGLEGAIYGSVASNVFQFVLVSLVLRQVMKREAVSYDYRHVGQELPVLWNFSIPALIMGLVVDPVGWACNAILANRPNGYAELGILSAATQWRGVVLFVPSNVSSVALPILANLLGRKESGKYAKLTCYNTAAAGVLALLPAIPIAFLAPFIMRQYGADFAAGAPVLAVSVLTAVAAVVSSTLGAAIQSAGRMWTGFFLNLVWAVVFLAGTWFLSAGHGALGVATALLAAYVCLAVLIGWVTRDVIRRMPKPETAGA